MASCHITSCHKDWGGIETLTDFIFLGSKITVDGDYSHGSKNTLAPWKKSYNIPRQHINKQRHCFANKDKDYMDSQSTVFSCSHVQM